MSAPRTDERRARRMVLASAGSGKTFYLSSRMIGLLACGEPVDGILASTFTRKAAAEILDRVLLRLARTADDEAAVRELAGSIHLPAGADGKPRVLDGDTCLSLLQELLGSIHRIRVGTLDGFFMQAALCFAAELDLSPGWSIADEAGGRQLQERALAALLAGRRPEVMAGSLLDLGRGAPGKSVHADLMRRADGLLRLQRELEPATDAAWQAEFACLPSATFPAPDERRRRRADLAGRLERVEAPLTGANKEDGRWRKAIDKLQAALATGLWKEVLGSGLVKKMLEGGQLRPAADLLYYSKAPTAALAAVLDEICDLARQELGERLRKQGEALGDLARRYADAFVACQQGKGVYRFEDITHALMVHPLFSGHDELTHRLDARLDHLLLDEFQDTSLPQWQVLEPLLAGLLADQSRPHAAVLVADPKQSIYGWRGARPELVAMVRERHQLESATLPMSWRSSPVVLEAVARVFDDLEHNPLLAEKPAVADAAAIWARDFRPQEAADPGRPGYVRLQVGPQPASQGTLQSGILDCAVETVQEAQRQAPRASIGVLVRENRSVAYLIAALRRAGVTASGEGGTALTDTAPVNAILALLRLADHPGDSIARYHVASTPVGRAAGYTDFADSAAAEALAARVRRELLETGYGAVLEAWRRDLAASCDARERARLGQLVELGFRWDARATLRPEEFSRFVAGERVEEPSAAPVRVMTVHQAKGLEFDVVVLPQLHTSLQPSPRDLFALPLRREDSGRPERIYPYADTATRALFPELQAAYAQFQRAGLRDALSSLYVAMTRARYALHLVLPADGDKGPSTTLSAAALLRATLAPGKPAEAGDGEFFTLGDAGWPARVAAAGWHGAAAPAPAAGSDTAAPSADGQPIALRRAGGRSSNLPTVPPSARGHEDVPDLARMMEIRHSDGARHEGIIVHAWCEEIEWRDGPAGTPGEEALLQRAREVAPGRPESDLRRLMRQFLGWLRAPAVGKLLAAASYPPGTLVERELPFVRRVPQGLMRGNIDRLVLVPRDGVAGPPGPGQVERAEVIDYKTDHLDAGDARALEEMVAGYRPQLTAYTEAVAERYKLAPERVEGKLVFLRAGLVAPV